MAQNFENIISAKAVGTADVEAQAAAIRKLAESIDGLGEKTRKVNDGFNFDKLAEQVRNGIQNPLQAIGAAAESALKSLGPVGVGIAAAAAAVAAFGKVSLDAAHSLGAFSDEVGDTAVRMGLSTRQVQEFRFAMNYVGGDMGNLQGIMRKLSAEIDDGGKNLKDLGINFRDVHSGAVLPMAGIIEQLSVKLRDMSSVTERNTVAVKVLGRSGLEVLPDLLELPEALEKARQMAIYFGDGSLKSMDDLRKKLVEVDAQWDFFIMKLKQGITIPLRWAVDDASKRVSSNGRELPPLPDLPDFNVLNREGQADPRLAGLRASLGAADLSPQVQAAKDLEAYLNRGLLGAQKKLEELKEAYEKADKAARSIAQSGSVDAAVAEKHRAEVEKAYAAYQRQADAVKLLTQAEERRIAALEKTRDLISQGYGKTLEGFYQFDNGAGITTITQQQIAAANRASDRINSLGRSLFGPRESNPFSVASGLQFQQGGMADLKEGLRVGSDGKLEFISPSSSRTGTVDITQNLDVLKARWDGFANKRQSDEETAANVLRIQYEQSARLIELRTGPGGELETAYKVAAVRQAALQDERERTGDIVRYQEESARNRMDLELRIAEIERRRVETMRSELGGLFDALVGGGSGLQGFLRSQALNAGRAGFSNTLTSLLSSHEKLTPSSIFGGTWLGELFGSGKQHTLETAGDRLILAAGDLRAAAREIALSPSSGGGGTAGSVRSAWQWLKAWDRGFQPSGTVGAEGVPEGNRLPTDILGQNGDWAGESAHPASMGLTWGKTAGLSAATLAGIYGLYAGIQRGGAQGGLMAGGSVLGAGGSIAALLAPASALGPIGILAGLGLGFASSLFPSHKQQRGDELEQERMARIYRGPEAREYNVDTAGRAVGSDYRGGVTIVQIQAVDTQSFRDAISRNGGAVVTAAANAVGSGDGEELVGHLMQRLGL